MSGLDVSSGRNPPAVRLDRSLGLPLLVLYGLGVTVGAGIYVLIGAAGARAGNAAPLAFLLAAVVMGLTGATFAEFAGRIPQSAGEGAYARAAFNSDMAALVTGGLVLLVALVSAATIAKGAVGYLTVFFPVPGPALTLGLIMLLGAVAAMGITEAVTLAAVMTVVEVGALIVIVGFGFVSFGSEIMSTARDMVPTISDAAAWRGVLSAFLLAFFAFIGFESLVNLAEEAHTPARIIPRAILWTLSISTVLYCLVVMVALATLSSDEMRTSKAPLALVFQRTTGAPQVVLSAIAVFATINGVIAQIILAARLFYGLARQGVLPDAFARVDRRTHTPLIATLTSTALIAALAMSASLEHLADATTRLMLVVFVIVNSALIIVKRRGDPAPPDGYVCPIWVPAAGAASSLVLLGVDITFG